MSDEPKDGLAELERIKALARAAYAIESFEWDWNAFDEAVATLIRERNEARQQAAAFRDLEWSYRHNEWLTDTRVEADEHEPRRRKLSWETPLSVPDPIGGG